MRVIGQQGTKRWLIQRGRGSLKYDSSCLIVDDGEERTWSVLYGSAVRRGVWDKPEPNVSARNLSARYPIVPLVVS